MHLSKVDLNLFVVFDTIYAEGGITRASRRLNLSQPAISHALGRLRAMFDDPLFTAPRPRHDADAAGAPHDRAGPPRLVRVGGDAQQGRPVRPRERGEALHRRHAQCGRVRRRAGAHAHHRQNGAARRHQHRAGPNAASWSGSCPPATWMRRSTCCCRCRRRYARQRIGVEWLTVVARRRHPHVRSRLDLDTYLAQEHILRLIAPPGPECGGLRARPAQPASPRAPALPELLCRLPAW